jgi:hypothetical protein
LAKLGTPSIARRFHLAGIVKAVQVVAGVLVVWGVFYGIGRLLSIIPSAFHEGTMWRKVFW